METASKKDFFGIININKPAGCTSHDVVAKVRKLLKIKQVGHTGTLDPMATGVMVVCIGKATKLIQYLESGKAYRASIKLGIETDTYDMEGKILSNNPANYDETKIKSFLSSITGDIEQIPPMHSAVHFEGKRLYEYARKNIDIKEIPRRKVRINSLEIISVSEITSGNPEITIDIDCSEGTYIRSVAHDLGEFTGTGACLSGLTRTRAGKFCIESSFTLEELQTLAENEKYSDFIMNPIEFINFPSVEINDDLLLKIKNGQFFYSEKNCNSNFVKLIYKNKLAAIARFEDNVIKPVNVFM